MQKKNKANTPKKKKAPARPCTCTMSDDEVYFYEVRRRGEIMKKFYEIYGRFPYEVALNSGSHGGSERFPSKDKDDWFLNAVLILMIAFSVGIGGAAFLAIF